MNDYLEVIEEESKVSKHCDDVLTRIVKKWERVFQTEYNNIAL